MQEEVQQRTVTLVLRTSKLTANALKTAIKKFLEYEKNGNRKSVNVKPQGKQSIKELAAQNQGLTNIEINDKNIKSFDRVARKYGIDYAVKKDKTSEPAKYLVFFKTKDADALTAAFKDYTKKAITKQKRKDSIRDKLAKAKEIVKSIPAKAKHKERER